MSPRNVELEGPISLQLGGDQNPHVFPHPVYFVHYDCDCGRRLVIMASTDGAFSKGTDGLGVNCWKLELGENRLSITPSILSDHGDGKPPCHFFITDEPFTRIGV